MPLQRLFLDWSQPALPAAAEYLIGRCAKDGALDLSGLIVVVPGSRAGRRLVEILVEKSDEKGLHFTPPRIVTEGTVPELLYVPKRPFADELTQKFAWAEALRSLAAGVRQPLVPHPPPTNDAERWLELGDLVRRIHMELAADGLDFQQVLGRGPGVPFFADQPRWQAMAAAQVAYHRRLDALGLWDVQTARLVAVKQREIATDKDLILIGAVDLNNTVRQMFDQLADRVTALVHAPKKLADRFDEHGCLVPAAWQNAEIPIAREQIERADGPADQADSVTGWLASLGGRYRADEVVIGVPDESLAPQLLRQLAQSGLAGRFVEARRLPETAPYRLLTALAEYADRRQFAELARLVRHADFERWLNEQAVSSGGVCDWLSALDKYFMESLPLRLDKKRLEREREDERHSAARIVGQLQLLIDKLLERVPVDQALPMAQWIEPLCGVLSAIYGGRTIDRDDTDDCYLAQALKKIITAIEALRAVPAELQPGVSFRQAAELALLPLQKESLPPPADPRAVELLGWLELALDDAPALVVTSVNEGIVPKSKTADAFLPNELRRHLELDDNDRRYARDAYALSVLAASRKELRLIVGHRDADGNPLAPSRLLFASDSETVAQRAVTLFDSPPAVIRRRQLLAGLPPAPKASALSPPKPDPLAESLSRISVTQFRSFLACPYRYYLSYVLRLEALRDDAEELDGGMFGELVHDVLQQFGRDETMRNSDEADAISDFLSERLAATSAARFGHLYSRPAIGMQVEQARRRLRTFADIQAQRAADGWRILHSEDTDKQLSTNFDVDSLATMLYGRIDRIDWHEPSNTILVLDYKTADAGEGPEKVHRRRGEWIDLQLPLYRHLLRSIPLDAGPAPDSPVALGFFLLPKDADRAAVAHADWTADDLAAADEVARDVIRKIRAQKFLPLTVPPPPFSDELAAICQDHRLGTWQELEEETP